MHPKCIKKRAEPSVLPFVLIDIEVLIFFWYLQFSEMGD
jgi:hypothetical protein